MLIDELEKLQSHGRNFFFSIMISLGLGFWTCQRSCQLTGENMGKL